jgi:hypothetical protein
MIFAKSREREGFTSSGDLGGCPSTIAQSVGVVSALNGRSPVTSLNRITPSDQISALPSTSRVERICSGDI